MRKNIKTIISAMILVIIFANVAFAEPSVSLFGKSITLENNNNPENYVFSIQLLFILTILTLAPSLLIMMTGFTRILIVLSFIRNALGLQQTPPNHVIIGLALFLTFFVMAPIATEINNEAIQPYIREEINQDIAINNAMNPIRNFMFKQTRDKDLGLFLSMKGTANISNISEIPTHVLVPACLLYTSRCV